jgi:hypothetical protein
MLWYFFPGDIGIQAEGGVIETRFGWVPILHFALSMANVLDVISQADNTSISYGFTEADEDIEFTRHGMNIRIEASFESTAVSCSLDEFRQSVTEFVRQVVADMGIKYPPFLATQLADEMLSSV